MKNKILFILMALFFFGAIKRLILGGGPEGSDGNMDTIIVELVLGLLCGAAIWQGKRSKKLDESIEN